MTIRLVTVTVDSGTVTVMTVTVGTLTVVTMTVMNVTAVTMTVVRRRVVTVSCGGGGESNDSEISDTDIKVIYSNDRGK